MSIDLFPFEHYWWFYASFTAFVLLLLALDLGVFHRDAHEVRFREAAILIVGIGDDPAARIDLLREMSVRIVFKTGDVVLGVRDRRHLVFLVVLEAPHTGPRVDLSDSVAHAIVGVL